MESLRLSALVAPPPRKWQGAAMDFWESRVLFIDGEAIVIDKPAGLAVHPGSRTPESLEDYLHHLRFGFRRLPLPAHRLDRDTSGCLLLARNPKAHKAFQRAFEEKRVGKTYVAVLDGVPEAEAGTVDMALGKTSTAEEGWRMVPDEAGKAAVTHWRVAAVRDGRAILVFTPETGRTHQIRVHAASGIGIPIIGDPVYGAGRGPMLLHALSLRVERNGKPPIEASAPLPPTFVNAGLGDVL
jgi:tRNA pseudouridine32 synthase/23S rRNA pseudouridine746 synthase